MVREAVFNVRPAFCLAVAGFEPAEDVRLVREFAFVERRVVKDALPDVLKKCVPADFEKLYNIAASIQSSKTEPVMGGGGG